MKLREYQAKEIFRSYGLKVPEGGLADTALAAADAAAAIGGAVVLKPQLGVKGRGKVGGIGFADNPDQARTEAERLLAATVHGEAVHRLLVEARVDIAEELYTAVTIDHARQLPVLVASRAGGVEIEEVARTAPERVLRLPIKIRSGPTAQDLAAVAETVGDDTAEVMATLWRIFAEHDAETVEINPLVRTTGGDLVAVDGVLNVDPDALFRHPDLVKLGAEIPVEDPIAEEAQRNYWTYIELAGDIGILSSGAGLTMAILDLLDRAGGQPANFIDTAQIDGEGIYKAFDLLARAKPTRAVLVNIFAGLNRCDLLAEGIVRYLGEHPPQVPIVVRMVGNLQEQGHRILRAAGIEPVTGIERAVQQVVDAAGGA